MVQKVRALVPRLVVPLALAASLGSLSSAPGYAHPVSAHSSTAARAPAQQLTLYVLRGQIAPGVRGVPGPDKKGHDAIVPANFVVKAGVPVVLKVINYDEGQHSITSPALGLNFVIKPGHELKNGTVEPVTSTFTFTAKKPGTFRWYCIYPCDKGANYWAMGQGYSGPGKEGFMAGFIVVLPR